MNSSYNLINELLHVQPYNEMTYITTSMKHNLNFLSSTNGYLNIDYVDSLFKVFESLIFKRIIRNFILILKCPKYLRTLLTAILILGNSSVYIKVS